MSSIEGPIDVAAFDRRRRFVGGFHEFQVDAAGGPVPGLAPGPRGKTLSRDPAGAVTRLVWFPGGWHGGRGSFSGLADVFVVSGEMICGGGAIGPLDFASFAPGQAVELFAPVPTVALLFALGPVSFHRGGASPEPFPVYRFGDRRWEAALDPAWEGTVVRPLHVDLDRDLATRVRGLVRWGDERWRSVPTALEWFVLDGELTVSEWLADGPIRHRYEPGGYLWRPAGVSHGGASWGTATYALVLERGAADPGETEYQAAPCSYPEGLD